MDKWKQKEEEVIKVNLHRRLLDQRFYPRVVVSVRFKDR